MDTFYSGFVATNYAHFPGPPYVGRGWRISLNDKPEHVTKHLHATINGISYRGKAVMIEARSLERALDVVELIYGSLCMIDGALPALVDLQDLNPRRIEPGALDDSGREEHWGHYESWDILRACMLAAKVSYRRAWQYGLFKYLRSQQTFSTNYMDLDPSRWNPTRFVFSSALIHVRCAEAILLAYSVLEELSLEIRASRSNPSTINGAWNPAVKSDLESRLRKAGVNLAEPTIWLLRDTPTRIEKERAPDISAPAEWAFWKIRDGNVELVDAILYASWLRSKISAHRLRDLAGSLNYYTVASVQILARRLFLEKMGFWRLSPSVR